MVCIRPKIFSASDRVKRKTAWQTNPNIIFYSKNVRRNDNLVFNLNRNWSFRPASFAAPNAILITVRQRSCGKVMFSYLFFCSQRDSVISPRDQTPHMVRHWTPKPAIISYTRSGPTRGNFFFAVVKSFGYKIAISANFVQTVKNSIVTFLVILRCSSYSTSLFSKIK